MNMKSLEKDLNLIRDEWSVLARRMEQILGPDNPASNAIRISIVDLANVMGKHGLTYN